MTEHLRDAFFEGQRDKVVQDAIKKIMGSHEYEEYIEDRIENVLSDLMFVPKVRDSSEL